MQLIDKKPPLKKFPEWKQLQKGYIGAIALAWIPTISSMLYSGLSQSSLLTSSQKVVLSALLLISSLSVTYLIRFKNYSENLEPLINELEKLRNKIPLVNKIPRLKNLTNPEKELLSEFIDNNKEIIEKNINVLSIRGNVEIQNLIDLQIIYVNFNIFPMSTTIKIDNDVRSYLNDIKQLLAIQNT